MRVKTVSYFALALGLIFGGALLAFHEESCEQLVHQSVAMFEREMRDQEGLISIGGGGNLNGGVNEVDVVFISCSRMNVEEARRVIVVAHQRLLEILNTNTKLKPYLHGRSLTIANVDISISYRTKSGGRPLDGSVALAYIAKGRIYYKKAELRTFTTIPTIDMTDDPIDTTIREYEEEIAIPLFDEPYEDALKIVQGDK